MRVVFEGIVKERDDKGKQMDRTLFIGTIFILFAVTLVVAAMSMPAKYCKYEKYLIVAAMPCIAIGMMFVTKVYGG